MAQTLPIKRFLPIGDSENTVIRRGVSYTPSAAMTLRHFSFVAQRQLANAFYDTSTAVTSLTEATSVTWEIRTGTTGNKPDTTTASLLDTGTFDWRYSSSWKLGRPIKYTINLTEGLALTAGTQYWFILMLASGQKYVLDWATTYETGAASEVDAAVYTSQYISSWSTGDNTFNLTLYVLDDQAGDDWHVVIDGRGYMQPDKMRGYRCEQVSSGLAASRGGQEEYSQLRYPYSNLSQSNWTSGSGQLTMDDPAAFLYAKNLDTTVPQQVTIGPAVTQTGLSTTLPKYEPVNNTIYTYLITLGSYAGAVRYLAQPFTTVDAATITSLSINAYKTPYYVDAVLSVAIYTNVSSSPGAIVGSWYTLSPTNSPEWLSVTTNESLDAATDYWLVLRTSQTNTYLGEFRVLASNVLPTYAGGAMKSSKDLSTWATGGTSSLAFRLNSTTYGEFEDTVVGIKYGAIGATGTLVAIAGKRVYTWSETNGYWTDITTNIEANADTDLSADATDLIFFDGKLLVAQGLEYPIRVWDGTYWSGGSGTTMISDGAMDSGDIGDWTAVNSVLSSEASGQSGNCLKILNNSTNYGVAKLAAITTVVGRWYELSFWQKNGDVGGMARIGTSDLGTEYWDSSGLSNANWAYYHKTFKATTTTTYISLWAASNVDTKYTFFDTVALREVPAAKYFHIGRGYLWASTAVNNVKRTNDLTSWSAAITVGENLYDITAMTNYQGRMLVGKEDGIWEVDQQDLATEYLIFREHADPNNCVGWSVWSGMLFIPVQNSIWRWQGSQYKDVGPTDKRSGPSKEWPNKVSRMTSTAPLLFASASPIVSTGYGGVLAYNGLGWHHIASNKDINTEARAICVTSEIGTNEVRVWWGDGKRISYAKWPTFTNNRYDWTSATYNNNGGVLVTSWWDGGLKDALKFWNRVTLIADIPSRGSISVYCARDGQDWQTTTDMIYLGTLFAENLSDNGEYALMFPDGMVAKSVQLVFMLHTDYSTSTPRIKAYNMESLVRQQPAYSYSFRILLADNITKMDGSTENTRGANTMWEELQRVAATNAPVIISFPYKSVRGVLSYLREETSSFKPDGMEEEAWERIASVSVVEAT